jgi:type I restriction enzyme S subunit
MKDSGVEWLGEVPEHWAIKKLRYCIAEHRQGYYTSDQYLDYGVKLLRITDLRDYGKIDSSTCPRVADRPEILPFLLKKGDFVFARTGGAGSFGLIGDVSEKLAYASYFIRFRMNSQLDIEFTRFFFLSWSFKIGIEKNIHGGVNQNVHAEDIKEQYLPLPAILEQKIIANFLDRETAKIDALIQETQTSIELLKEHRTALISAAVTGKIDVREAA